MNADLTIDEHRLRDLESDFGADGLAMVVEAYLEESVEVVEALGQLLSDEPDQSRVEHFHFLSGAAHNLGARRFGDLCRHLEQKNGRFTANDYSAFRAEYQAVKDYFVTRFGQSAA
ncbi:MAG: Hpt domain-containing protein [Pseudomonadota bacterium]